MRELIKINNKEINNELIQTVNARELHSFLESKRQFSDWIKTKLERLRLVENKDFVIVSQNCETIDKNGNKKVSVANEYFITLDTAKHIAMMENTDRGFEVRDYFIECEKQLRSRPSLSPKQVCFLSIAEASSQQEILIGLNRLNNEVIVPLENKVEEQTQELIKTKPKVDYHDIVLACPDLLTITQIFQDYPISNQKLNKILADEGIQYKDKSGVWCVYAKYGMNQYAQTSTHTYTDNNGRVHAKLHLKWTQKGRLFIYNLLKSKGILPICEQED